MQSTDLTITEINHLFYLTFMVFFLLHCKKSKSRIKEEISILQTICHGSDIARYLTETLFCICILDTSLDLCISCNIISIKSLVQAQISLISYLSRHHCYRDYHLIYYHLIALKSPFLLFSYYLYFAIFNNPTCLSCRFVSLLILTHFIHFNLLG